VRQYCVCERPWPVLLYVWLWRLRLLFLVILGCTLAHSAPIGAAEAPSKGGTIVWAVHESMPDFDIHYSDTYIVAQPIGPLYNGLLTFDMYDNEKIVGDLAERWEITEDGKRITFALHKGVKFHDGTNFTCADAIYSLEKLTDPKRAGTLFVTLWKISSPVPAVLTILPWFCPSRSPRLWC
jgi:peptide/nickel transport system substrate-binding protein